MPRTFATPTNLNPLAHLIRQRMQDRGWSSYDVERNGGPPARTVQHLADARVDWRQQPRQKTIGLLAIGLQLSEGEIRTAAGLATGMTSANALSDRLAAIINEFPEDRRKTVVDAVVAMLRAAL